MAASNQQALYPPPPDFYRLYAPTASGPLPPLPPAPPRGEYESFNEIFTTEVGLAPLRVQQLFKEAPDGRVDFRASLLALHAELCGAVQDLIRVLAQQPSDYARALETVGVLLRNMAHLARAMRPHQARATLAQMLRAEAAEHEAAADEIWDVVAKCDRDARQAIDAIANATKSLVAES